MHVALARKYRPKRFADLVGQEHVARALRGAIEANRVAHGYLLSGPRGVGKTTAARILAMALNCESRHDPRPTTHDARPAGEPCGDCASCQRIWAGSASLDVVEIDAASNRGVDDARELRERAMYAASQEGRYKVYIVDEAHMLTREAWNALLKVLEEPPPRVVFVFATTEPQKITQFAAPVMSRLQRFDFRPVGPQAIAARLTGVARAEGVQADDDAIELIARVANGGMRDALSVLDQVGAFGGGAITAPRVREVLGLVGDETFAELFAIVAGRRAGDVFPFVAKLVESGVDLMSFAQGAGDLWRAALSMRLGAPPDGISHALAERIRPELDALAPGDLLRILRSLIEAEEPIKLGAAPRLTLETLVVRWTLMDRTVEIAELIGQTGNRQSGIGNRETGNRESAIGSREQAPAPAPRAEPRSVMAPSSAPVVREVSPAAPSAPIPDSRSPIAGSSPADIRAAWPHIIEALRNENKRMVAETLGDVEPIGGQGGVITMRPLGGNQMTPDMITRYRATIEAAASRVLGLPVKIDLQSPGASAPASRVEAAPEPVGAASARRLSPQAAKSERAKALKGKDPALDKAIEAMDLELLD